MNEELVLHILNTACYGLNLHFSLIPQPPYLYIFFDRLPEADLNYSALTETLRLAAASAGLPPEYEYLALYSRILGEADPDWETAIYLYQETTPPAVYEDAHDPKGQDEAEPQIEPPAVAEASDNLSIEAVESEAEQEVEAPDPELPIPLQDDFDEIIVDPTIVFADDENDQEAHPEPVPAAASEEKPLDEGKGANRLETNTVDTAGTAGAVTVGTLDIDNDNNEDIEDLSSLPLPPPPPRGPAASAPPEKPSTPQRLEDDMSQFYFKAKAKPKVAPPPTETIDPTPTADAEVAVPSSPSEIVDLSRYCFIRNKLMLTSPIKPPASKVRDLIGKLHSFPDSEKNRIAAILDKLYRQPEKNEEGSGEAVLYQPADIDLSGLSAPIQDWFKAILALEPESFRKSAIWFSRYCHNPQKAIEDLSIPG